LKISGVRPRVLITAVLPVTLVAALLSVVVIWSRIGEMESDHRERALATARQIAATAEFGLFTGNDAVLQTLVNAVSRQTDVRTVTLLRRDGTMAARAGHPIQAPPRLPIRPAETLEEIRDDVRRVIQTVTATDVPLEEWIEGRPAESPGGGTMLGYAVVDLSLAPIKAAERRLLLAGLLVTVAGLLLGWALAVRIERTQKDLERRIAEATAELRTKKEEAELATLAKSRFLAFASHDLRQPMHALGLFVARLDQLSHDTETRELIGHLDTSVRALQDLLDAILDISRLDARVETPCAEPVAIAALWEYMEPEFAAAAEQKGIALRVRPSVLWVMSDPRLLHRMLLNLVSNAVRYTAHGGVLITCRRRGDHAQIEVRDTGPGIPRELQDEVFKEFVQLDNPGRERGKGLGLGLTIVEATARLLGHPLTLISLPGRGSCFRIELPLAAPPNNGGGNAVIPGQSDLQGLTVLVVDDDELARTAVVGLLQSWGCLVFSAAGGDDALNIVSRIGAPDIIACDFHLGRGDTAIELVAQLRDAVGAPVPAFVMSGDTSPEVVQATEKAGLLLLHKPVRPARLRALIHRLGNPV
jgi:signal transduction histidine kinase/CheY-like chemotaxis protein